MVKFSSFFIAVEKFHENGSVSNKRDEGIENSFAAQHNNLNAQNGSV